jgi:membrane peptidoglycan carboxypeptidase
MATCPIHRTAIAGWVCHAVSGRKRRQSKFAQLVASGAANSADVQRLSQRYHAFRSSRIDHEVPDCLIEALVAGEDHRFWHHNGVDYLALCRVAYERVTKHKRSGGSTSEQQLVRVLTSRFEPTIRRKLREMLLAIVVSQLIPKRDVAEMYLSFAYFGWRMNGLDQACRRLGVGLSTMSDADAAAIIARLKYPQPQRPSQNRLEQISRRTAWIQMMMAASPRYSDGPSTRVHGTS